MEYKVSIKIVNTNHLAIECFYSFVVNVKTTKKTTTTKTIAKTETKNIVPGEPLTCFDYIMYKYRYITARGKDAKRHHLSHDSKQKQQQQQQLLPSTDPSSVSASVSVSKVAKERPRKSHGSVIIQSSLLKDDEFGEIIHEGSNACYKYRDLANVPEKDLDDQSEKSLPAAGRTRGSTESIRIQKFPLKLYAILAQKEFQEIISWLPHGRSWRVHKPSLFETRVMPLFFEYSNYHSFNRLINAWSFRRITSGIDRGSYYHEVSTPRLILGWSKGRRIRCI